LIFVKQLSLSKPDNIKKNEISNNFKVIQAFKSVFCFLIIKFDACLFFHLFVENVPCSFGLLYGPSLPRLLFVNILSVELGTLD
jgi:hypothetical protein